MQADPRKHFDSNLLNQASKLISKHLICRTINIKVIHNRLLTVELSIIIPMLMFLAEEHIRHQN